MTKEKNFYQCDNDILSFDVNKEINEIRFNHYLMQKENIQRINGELPKGYFKLTLSTAEKDLGISKKILRRMIDEFVRLGVITRVDDNPKGSKLPSIYTYNTVKNYEKKGTEKDTEKGTSKKEYIKREYKKNIYIDFVKEIISLYPGKKIKSVRDKKLPKIIKQYGEEQIKRCVLRYSKECKGKEKQFVLNESTFWNGRYMDYLDKEEPYHKKERKKINFKNYDDF